MAVYTGVQSGRQSVRKRFRWWAALLAAASLAAIAAGGGFFRDMLWPKGDAQLIFDRARIGDFAHDVVDRGEVESSANVDVVCEVQSQNAEGVRIIEIVPEGSIVNAGDFLVKLDDAKLRTDRAAQQIAVNTAAAASSQAQNELDAFLIARREYELGTFKQEEAKLESELLVAEENIRRSESTLKYSRRMVRKGYIDGSKLEADEFAVEKYRKEREVAKIKLDVLRDYTKEKTLKKHESDIKTAEAKVKSERAKHQIELEKLDQIESQLKKCVITAPRDGQVVYAQREPWRSTGDDTIRAGTRVREQQVIIRLPDPTKMQVKARVSEARVDRVKPGMNVEIALDALPSLKLKGRVKTVNPYPSNDNWFNSNVKEYATYVEIFAPPAALRPGMSAQVSIRVETISDVLQVPVQAVVERGRKFYCLVREPTDKLVAREVLIGSTNEKFLVVREGLGEGQEVLMNPRAHLEEVGLPAIDSTAKVVARSGAPAAGDDTRSSVSSAPVKRADTAKPVASAASNPAAAGSTSAAESGPGA